MQTWVYRNKEGVDYMVVHRNTSLLIWDHPYDERSTCKVCLGESEAAPNLSTPIKEAVGTDTDAGKEV